MPTFKLSGKTPCQKDSLTISDVLVLMTPADILTNFGDMPNKSIAFLVSKCFSTLATSSGVAVRKGYVHWDFLSNLEFGYSILLCISIGSMRHLQNSFETCLLPNCNL